MTTFTVLTDHNPLQYLMKQSTLSGRQARGMEYLSRFNFEIKYIRGETDVADGLSRLHNECGEEMLAESATATVFTRAQRARQELHAQPAEVSPQTWGPQLNGGGEVGEGPNSA
jgi:hypothetical protein